MKTRFRIPIFLFVFLMLFNLAIFGVSADDALLYPYKERVLELFVQEFGLPQFESYYYDEHYEYYGAESADDAAPEFILVEIKDPLYNGIEAKSYMGEYLVKTMYYTPEKHGLFIYLPEEDELYTLEEAYSEGIQGIEDAVLTLKYNVYLLGDCDGDSKVTIQDATIIQKKIAGLETEMNQYWCWDLDDVSLYDFNCDEEVDIKDVTAIQKHIARIVE